MGARGAVGCGGALSREVPFELKRDRENAMAAPDQKMYWDLLETLAVDWYAG